MIDAIAHKTLEILLRCSVYVLRISIFQLTDNFVDGIKFACDFEFKIVCAFLCIRFECSALRSVQYESDGYN